jgi:SAM-dependent methyltransferase
MNFSYPGTELELFAAATNWKNYVAAMAAPFVGNSVLDVGAGIGTNVLFLSKPCIQDWLCLEPDQRLASQIARRIARGELPASCRVVNGTLEQLDEPARFATVLYLDVLEHIADDRAEMAKAASFLANGGSLIVLAPAHQFLFSAFDGAIGHYRRYSAQSLMALAPPGCRLISCRMLDSAGFFASLANRLVRRSVAPSPRQVAFWNRVLVPFSRRVDPCLGYRFGKSILAIWTTTSAGVAAP